MPSDDPFDWGESEGKLTREQRRQAAYDPVAAAEVNYRRRVRPGFADRVECVGRQLAQRKGLSECGY